MAAIFKYNGKLYQAADLKKKLKRLKISEADIEILLEGDYSKGDLEKLFNSLNTPTKKEEVIENNSDIILYKYSNGNKVIVSVYSDNPYEGYKLVDSTTYKM